MKISEHVIHLAKERALFGFRVMARDLTQGAAVEALRRAREAESADEAQQLRQAQQYLQDHAKPLQTRMESHYRDLLDRAMQTMYADLRAPLGRISADSLTLIDDDTMDRQIRIDHMVKRLRDADDEHLQRVNLIIGRMHGSHEAKERENPFRPYLMARALHQAVHDVVADRHVAARVFELLSDALAAQLSHFYRAIRDVFESNGIQAQLVARKSLYGGSVLSEQVARDLNNRVIPGLKRAIDTLNTGAPGQPQEVRRFVDGIFDAQPEPGGTPGAGSAASPLRAGSRQLVERLDGFQRQAARGEASAPGLQMAPDEATTLERVAIDVVAALFELILADEQIPDRVRTQIGRLQIPFLKAAMLAPEILRQASHPARQLVNRMGSAAVGLDAGSPVGEKVEREVARIVSKVLVEFHDDVGMFAVCLAEFEQFLAEHLHRTDPVAEKSALALDDVENGARQGGGAPNVIRTLAILAWLRDVNVDQAVVDFIAQTWMRVIERERELAPDAAANPEGSFYDVLPDLVWSAQPKPDAQERAALVRMLPGLVKRLQAGLSLLGLSAEETRRELDRLVAVHTQVLRAGAAAPDAQSPPLAALRERFAAQKASVENAAPAPLEAARFETELAKRGVAVDLDIEREPAPSFASDGEWLDTVKVGTCLERWSDDGFQKGCLVWISKRKTLYLLKLKDQGMPVVYSKSSLTRALREGSLRPIEGAPAFDRAVQMLLSTIRSAGA